MKLLSLTFALSLVLLAAAPKKGRYRLLNAEAPAGPVDIAVTAGEPIPVRALEPVLNVGKIACTQYRYTADPNTMIFTCDQREKLADNAEMNVGFSGDPAWRLNVGNWRPRL